MQLAKIDFSSLELNLRQLANPNYQAAEDLEAVTGDETTEENSFFTCYSISSKNGKSSLRERKLVHRGQNMQLLGSSSGDKILFEAALNELFCEQLPTQSYQEGHKALPTELHPLKFKPKRGGWKLTVYFRTEGERQQVLSLVKDQQGTETSQLVE